MAIDEIGASVDTERPSWLLLSPWELHHAGGVNQAILNLLRQIALHGEYVPRVLINDWSYRSLHESEEQGHHTVRFRLMSPWDSSRSLKHFVGFLLLLPTTLWQLLQFIQKRQIRVINAYWPTLSFLCLAILRRLQIFTGTFILTFQGGDIRSASMTTGVERLLWQWLLRSADVIVTCSNDLRQEVLFVSPSCGNKTITVHNGVDLTMLERERHTGRALDDRLRQHPFILNVATFEWKKGQDTLIRAFAEVARRFPEMFLVLIGRSADFYPTIVELIASLQLQERVLLYENLAHEDVVPFFPQATIFVLSSRIEPFGIVTIEAGAFGIPVVATRVGGVPEIIEDGVTGCLVPAEDVEAMATTIIALLEHPERRRQLGARLQSHVRANFTWERAFSQYMAKL